jgi:filamentous hemagglutinin family protein
MTKKNKRLASGIAGLLTAVCIVGPAEAYVSPNTLPTGGSVASGSATISTNYAAHKQTINQSSNAAIINWGTFSIGSNATVQFVQPSATAVTLNRVKGVKPSEIYGHLTANGNIILVNGNGIYFKNGSRVNVGGLVATTIPITDADFDEGTKTGKYVFRHADTTPGEIKISRDSIITVGAQDASGVREGGLLALVAPQVTNDGRIYARLGKVHVGSGDSFAVDLYGDGLINLQASDSMTKQELQNNGAIYANGGEVMMSAATAKNVVDALVNVEGLIQADTIDNKNGRIVLSGDVVGVGGSLLARGDEAKGETGGSIALEGNEVYICCGKIDATGKAAEGTGQVAFKADTLWMDEGSSTKTNGDVKFEPMSANRDIEVAGTYDLLGYDKLYVSKTILDNVEQAGSITIGNTTRDTGTLTALAYDWRAPVRMLNYTGDIVIAGLQNMDYASKKHHHHHGEGKPKVQSYTFLANTVGGNIVIDKNGGVKSGAKGDAIVLAASGGKFMNHAGPAALSAPNGRWLVYSSHPDGNLYGDLNSNNTAVWNTVYTTGGTVSQTGNRYVFAYQPTVTLKPDNMKKDFGVNYTVQVGNDTYTMSGLHEGVSGAFLGDTPATAFGGTPVITSAGSPAGAVPGYYNIDMSGLTGLNGYKVAYEPGTLTVWGKPDLDGVLERGKRGPGKRGPIGTLLSIVNGSFVPPGSLPELAPNAGGDTTTLADLAPAAGGGSGVTPLIQCNEVTPCDIAQ